MNPTSIQQAISKKNMFERGKIVLVPFPFTDLSSAKVRPALIISAPKYSGEDISVVFISSKITKGASPTDCIIKSSHPSFEKTGLKVNSLIRCNKAATLDKKIVLGEIGELSSEDKKEVDCKLNLALGLGGSKP